MREFKKILTEATQGGSPITKKMKSTKDIQGFLKTVSKYFKKVKVGASIYIPATKEEYDGSIALLGDKLIMTGPQMDSTTLDVNKDKIEITNPVAIIQ